MALKASKTLHTSINLVWRARHVRSILVYIAHLACFLAIHLVERVERVAGQAGRMDSWLVTASHWGEDEPKSSSLPPSFASVLPQSHSEWMPGRQAGPKPLVLHPIIERTRDRERDRPAQAQLRSVAAAAKEADLSVDVECNGTRFYLNNKWQHKALTPMAKIVLLMCRDVSESGIGDSVIRVN